MLHHLTPKTVRSIWRTSGISVIVAMLMACIFFAIPFLTEYRELQRRLEWIESIRSTEHSVAANLELTSKRIEALRAEAELLRERASPKNDETAFLQWANSQTNSIGLLVRDFRPSSRENQGEYVTRTMILSTEGSYESICNFLDSLRCCPQMIRVTHLEIVPQNQSRTTFGATLSIVLFTSGQPQTARQISQG